MIPSVLFGISPFWGRTGLRIPAVEDGISISSRLRIRAFTAPVEQTSSRPTRATVFDGTLVYPAELTTPRYRLPPIAVVRVGHQKMTGQRRYTLS